MTAYSTAVLIGALLSAALAVAQAQSLAGWSASLFWADGVTDPLETVGGRSADGGRFVGIFNQPAEAGAGYLLAVVSLRWLSSTQRLPTSATTAAGLLLFVGVVLSGSKIALFGSLIVFGWSAVARSLSSSTSRWRSRRMLALLLPLVVISVLPSPIRSYYLPERASDRLASLLFDRLANDPIDALSAGRVEDTAAVSAIVAERSPIYGVGFAGAAGPTDNALLGAYVVAGLPGLLLLTLLLGRSVRLIGAGRASSPGSNFRQGIHIVFLVTAGGVLPLTANRVSTLIVLGLFLATATQPVLRGRDSARGETSVHPRSSALTGVGGA